MGNRNNVNIFKRFFGNKNVVTFIGILICVATLVIGYNIRVKKAISPVIVPYAKQTIQARSPITAEMVGKIKISSSYVSSASNLITSVNEVVNKYATYKTNIPSGSLFYDELVMEANEMPDYAFSDIEDGYTIYSLSVNKDSTYANSIRAGDYIDLYMSATETGTNEIIFGRLVQSIKVLTVKDSYGENIINNTLSSGTPAELLFAVEDDMYELLMIAGYIGKNISITPVIRNANYTSEANSTMVSSEYLRTFILDNSKDLAE